MFNQRLGKYLILFVLLVLPVGVFLFLKLFGTNHYDLPIFIPGENTDSVILFSKSEEEVNSEPDSASIIIESYGWANEKFASKNALLFRIQDRYAGSKGIIIISYDTTLELPYSEMYFPTGFPDTMIWKLSQNSPHSGNTLPQIALEEEQKRKTIPMESVFILKDEKLRVRGIFDTRDEKEFDRIILETEVLLYGREKK